MTLNVNDAALTSSCGGEISVVQFIASRTSYALPANKNIFLTVQISAALAFTLPTTVTTVIPAVTGTYSIPINLTGCSLPISYSITSASTEVSLATVAGSGTAGAVLTYRIDNFAAQVTQGSLSEIRVTAQTSRQSVT